MEEFKDCFNCAYKKGSRCTLSGQFWEIEREYNSKCNSNFSGWKPESVKERKKGLKQWIKELWYGN